MSPELALFKLNGLAICAWMSGTGEMDYAEQFLMGLNRSFKARSWPNPSNFILPLSKLVSNLLCHLLRGAQQQHGHISRLIILGLEGLALLVSDSNAFSSEPSSLAFNLLQSLFDTTMKASDAEVQKRDPAAPKPLPLNIKRKEDDIRDQAIPQPDASKQSFAIRRERLNLLLLSLPLLDHLMPDLLLGADERFDRVLSILVKMIKDEKEHHPDDGLVISQIKRKALGSLNLASELSPSSLIAICHSFPLPFFFESLSSVHGADASDLLQLLHLKLASDRSLSSDNLHKLTLVLFELVYRSISVAQALNCLRQIALHTPKSPRPETIRSAFSSHVPLLLTLSIMPISSDAVESVAASHVLAALAQDDLMVPLLTSDLTGEGSVVDYIAASALALMQKPQGPITDSLRGAYLAFLHTVTMSLTGLPRSSAPVVASALLSLLATSSSCQDSLRAARAILHLVTEEGEVVCRSLLDQNALPLVKALVKSDPSLTAENEGQLFLTSQYVEEIWQYVEDPAPRIVGKRYEIDADENTRTELRSALCALLDELLVFKTMSSSSDGRQPLRPLLPLPSPQQQLDLPLGQHQGDEVMKALSLQKGDSMQFDEEVMVQGEPMRVVSVVRSVRKGASTSYTFEDRVFSVPPSHHSTPSRNKHLAPPRHLPLPLPPSITQRETLGKKIASILQLSHSSTPVRGGHGVDESPRKMKRMTIEDIVASSLQTPSERKAVPQSERGSAKRGSTPATSDLAKLKSLAGQQLIQRSADRSRPQT
jgi:hypothetical protein